MVSEIPHTESLGFRAGAFFFSFFKMFSCKAFINLSATLLGSILPTVAAVI
jgi:hypothetical protein